MSADAPSQSSADAPVATVPPRRAVRRRLPPDRNRPLEILSVLLLYVIVVHYALKFAAFFLPDEEPTKDEMLGIRGASGVLGFSLGGAPLPRRKLILRNGGSSFVHTLYSTAVDSPESLLDSPVKDAQATDNNTGAEQARATEHKWKRIPILSYQDDYVIVSKPAGMTMHHNAKSRWGRSNSPVLQTAIKKQLSRKPYLVHRLDHRTSGACILGFDSETAGELHGRLRRKDAVKLYVALVRGDLRESFRCAAEASEDGVDMSLDGGGSVIGSQGMVPDIMVATERGETPDSETSSCEYNGRITVDLPITVGEIKKEAKTDFYFLSSIDLHDDDEEEEEEDRNAGDNTTPGSKTPYTNKSLTLLLCRPRTGRTHQIRKHVQRALRAPIIGDSEHGDSRVNRYWRTNIGLDRLGLHCWHLCLPPFSSDEGAIECRAPLASDFAAALQHERLRPLWEEATRVEPRLRMEPCDERGGTYGRNYRKRHSEDGEKC